MRPKQLPHRRVRHSAGFSLVEVLISIVVLSFGMLGMVGLQAAALQANREARMQSTATNLARELAEKMRGNHTVAILTTANPYIGNFTSPLTATTPTFCLSVGATPCANVTAVANAEMTEWLSRVDDALPGARVRVCFDSTPYTAAGLPQWDCSDTGDIAVVKIGWTRGSTDRTPAKASSAAFERATAPSVSVPVTPASAL